MELGGGWGGLPGELGWVGGGEVYARACTERTAQGGGGTERKEGGGRGRGRRDEPAAFRRAIGPSAAAWIRDSDSRNSPSLPVGPAHPAYTRARSLFLSPSLFSGSRH